MQEVFEEQVAAAGFAAGFAGASGFFLAAFGVAVAEEVGGVVPQKAGVEAAAGGFGFSGDEFEARDEFGADAFLAFFAVAALFDAFAAVFEAQEAAFAVDDEAEAEFLEAAPHFRQVLPFGAEAVVEFVEAGEDHRRAWVRGGMLRMPSRSSAMKKTGSALCRLWVWAQMTLPCGSSR